MAALARLLAAVMLGQGIIGFLILEHVHLLASEEVQLLLGVVDVLEVIDLNLHLRSDRVMGALGGVCLRNLGAVVLNRLPIKGLLLVRIWLDKVIPNVAKVRIGLRYPARIAIGQVLFFLFPRIVLAVPGRFRVVRLLVIALGEGAQKVPRAHAGVLEVGTEQIGEVGPAPLPLQLLFELLELGQIALKLLPLRVTVLVGTEQPVARGGSLPGAVSEARILRFLGSLLGDLAEIVPPRQVQRVLVGVPMLGRAHGRHVAVALERFLEQAQLIVRADLLDIILAVQIPRFERGLLHLPIPRESVLVPLLGG